MTLAERLYALLREIPAGKVVTYGALAKKLGNPGLARVVGNLLHRNPDPLANPCYKAVNAQGRLSEHFGDGGIGVQAKRLENEGIEVKNNTVDLKKYGYYFPEEENSGESTEI